MLSVSSNARASVLRVNTAAPGPTQDGQTWDTAFQALKPAMDAATDGDEIWVAQDAYNTSIETTKAVRLYGGFDGTETDRSARDPQAHLTVLQGDGFGPIVRFTDVPATGSIDGFTLRGGLYGVSLEGGAPVIAGNVFTANEVAIDALESSPTVSANRFHANFDGLRFDGGAPVVHANVLLGQTRNGIACWDGGAVIRDNAVLGCGESGLYVLGGTPTAVNNTVIGCQTGATIDGAAATLTNNLVAWHYVGVSAMGGATVTLRSNGFYGSRTPFYGVADPTGTNGNTTADPKVASATYGNFHLQPDSPMRDAGDDAAVASGDTDVDGQPRLQGTVDIGADESDGTAWTVTPSIVRVSADTGDDSNDGSDWTRAKKTIQAGMDSAMLTGGEVWVAGGTYAESLTLRPFTYLYGGFSGNEQTREPGHRQFGGTVLSSIATPKQVKVRGGHTFTLMDSLTFDGLASLIGSSTTLANNTFNGGTISQTYDGAKIQHNQFILVGTGVKAESSQPEILHNVFARAAAALPSIGSAISFTACGGLIAGNLIATYATNSQDTGIYMLNSAPSILNNTLSGSMMGIRYTVVEPLIANNIIRSTSATINRIGSTATPAIRNNVFYGAGSNFQPTLIGVNGNVFKDPKFRDPAHGNFRLAAGSPGIDTGDDSVVSPGMTDLDGKQRILGAHVDIGAYEYTATQFVLADAVQAIRIAAGMMAGTVADVVRLDIDTTGVSGGRVDLGDSLSVLRQAFGLDPAQ